VALPGSALAVILLFLTSIYAGPLWRDEVNTVNVAQMPTMKDFWSNMPFESFPPLWPLILRAWTFLGLADSDAGIRLLGFFFGLCFLGSLWVCLRWMGGRAPTLTLALLGSLPAFVFTMSSNRAYGLALCFLVLTFGAIWRVIELPSTGRILLAGLTSLLFVHCVYYDAIFLCAILFGAAVVTLRNRQWKTFTALVGIGVLTGPTVLVYLPIIHQGSVYAPIIRVPFGLPRLWGKLRDALEARSSAQPSGHNGQIVWLWLLLMAAAIIATLIVQRRRAISPEQEQPHYRQKGPQTRADLALFSLSSLVCGTAGYVAFLFFLQYPTETWYYTGLLTLCAIGLEGVLNVSMPSLLPWGALRIGLLLGMTAWNARSVWEEAHTRRSNVDVIAAILSERAKEGDLIVVHFAWEGITFERYYHGSVPWMAIPPIASHKVHRNDLMLEKMKEREPLGQLLGEASKALENGKSVWVIGHVALVLPQNLPPAPGPMNPKAPSYLGPYWWHWGAEVTSTLLAKGARPSSVTTTLDVPVNACENLPLLEFSKYLAPERQQTKSRPAVTHEASVSK